MMLQDKLIAIGLRAEKDAVTWSIVAGSKSNPILIAKAKLKTPAIHKDYEPSRLSWIKGQVLDVLAQYQPTVGAIRYPEPSSPGNTNSKRERSRIEGVVIQALCEKNIKVITLVNNQIASALEVKPQSVKNIMDESNFRGLDWLATNDIMKEAILAASTVLEG
jgi:Holliday junction resolvasome RuvABC endonuclease subunit